MKVIRYLWVTNNDRIEMAGIFTPERWDSFCKKPHPWRDGITIVRLP